MSIIDSPKQGRTIALVGAVSSPSSGGINT